MLIGYARVSTLDQNPALQEDALQAAGCERIFLDRISGAQANRPALQESLSFARSGDTIVVWRLDRLARSVTDLIQITQSLNEAGIGFKSLTETIDTTTTGGRLVFTVFAAIAQFERDLIRERTMAGLAAARSRGKIGGRPRVMTPDKVEAAKRLLLSGMNAREVAQAVGVSTPTLYRHIDVGTVIRDTRDAKGSLRPPTVPASRY